MPSNYSLIGIGFILHGIMEPIILLFTYPEAIEQFYYHHGIREGENPDFDNLISNKFGSLNAFL